MITQPLVPAVLPVVEDAAADLAVSATDADGHTLTWTTSAPAKGVVTGQGTGLNRILTYTANPDANGSDAFIITVTDSVGGTATRPVAVTIAAVNDPPVNTALPAISGSATVGQVLTATTGAWTDAADGNPTVSVFAYQWRRAASATGPATAIPGATAQTYLLAPSDLGSRLEVLVTAQDAGTPGSATAAAVSLRTAAVVPAGVSNPGDTNGDLVVNAVDLNAVKASFGRAQGDLGFNPGADLNQDGIVNVMDLNLVKANFGKTY